MRVSAFVFALVATAACSTEGPTTHASSAIAFGSVDTTHTSVVALLGLDGNNGYVACSGTIVQIKTGVAYVLTAAHCCSAPQTTFKLAVASNDYSVAAGQLGSEAGSPQPPAYAIDYNSIWYDPAFDAQTGAHDFCMLQTPAPGGAVAIPLPSGSDNMSTASIVDIVGFGSTNTSISNTKRYRGVASLSSVDATTLAMPLGPTHPGPCEGDSGGPVLAPSGSPQISQTVVGVISEPQAACGASGTGFASRVTSALGTGGFISSYLADAPVGTHLAGPIDAGTDASTSSDASTSDAAIADAASEAAPTVDASNDAGTTPSNGGGGGCNTHGSPTRTATPAWLVGLVTLLALRRARRTA